MLHDIIPYISVSK